MKKLLMSAIVLLLFAISFTLVQTSCSKSIASPLDNSQLGKIIYFTEYPTADTKLWIANYDGSNAVQVPLTLPSNLVFDGTVNSQTLRISPDGQTIFFSVYDKTATLYKASIYSCDAAGNNLKPVVSASAAPGNILFGEAY